MDRNVFLSILAMDSYNRGYNLGVSGLAAAGRIGKAQIFTHAIAKLDPEEVVGAGFYAIAYDMTGVVGFSVGEKVISYRGTDNYNPLALGNDLWNGWTLGAGFADASQGGLAAQLS